MVIRCKHSIYYTILKQIIDKPNIKISKLSLKTNVNVTLLHGYINKLIQLKCISIKNNIFYVEWSGYIYCEQYEFVSKMLCEDL